MDLPAKTRREPMTCRDALMPRSHGCEKSGDVQGCTNAASAGMRKSGPWVLERSSLLRRVWFDQPTLRFQSH